MTKLKLSNETMLSILYGDEGEVLRNQIVGHSRWSVNHEVIFRYGDKLYQAYYSVGATETQDEVPWEYEKEVECVEVEPYEKTVIDYRTV